MRVDLELPDGVDRRNADVARLCGAAQLLHPLSGHPLGQVDVEDIHVLATGGAGSEHLEVSPVGIAHQRHEGPPLFFFGADELDETVLAPVDVPGHDDLHAQPGGVHSLIGRAGGCRLRHLRSGGEHREIDMCALTG